MERVLGDYDVWYKKCEKCGYDTGKSTTPKDGNKTCWRCGNFLKRDYSDRALKIYTMKELTEHKINELKSCASIKALIQGRELTVHQRGDAQQELDRLLSVLDALLSKDQPVVGAEELRKGFEKFNHAFVVDCIDKLVEIAEKYTSAVAFKMARENEELKGRVREIESALRWMLWNAHIPSGLGEERVKEIEELITPRDINGNPLNSKTN